MMTLNQSSNHTQPLKPKLSWEAFCLGGWKDLRAASAERCDWRGDGEIAGHLTGGIFWLKIRIYSSWRAISFKPTFFSLLSVSISRSV